MTPADPDNPVGPTEPPLVVDPIPPCDPLDPLPPRRRFSSLWDFVVRAWRVMAAWFGVATIGVHGVVIPLLPVFGHAPVAVDWLGLAAFLTVVFGPLVAARTIEKLNGVTS